MDSGQLAFEIRLAHALAVMGLLSVSIHRSAVLDDGLHQFNTLVHLPREGVVIVIDQNGIRPTFTSHLESRGNKVVLVLAIHHAVATKCFDNVGATALGIVGTATFGTLGGLAVAGVVVVASPNGLVHHVDVFQVGELGGNGIKPFRNILLGQFNRDARVFLFAEEVRVLGTPHQGVELEVALTGFFLCPLVGPIAFIVVVPGKLAGAGVSVGKAVDRAPLTAVFSRNLVPVGAHVATDLTTCGDVSQELGTTVG